MHGYRSTRPKAARVAEVDDRPDDHLPRAPRIDARPPNAGWPSPENPPNYAERSRELRPFSFLRCPRSSGVQSGDFAL